MTRWPGSPDWLSFPERTSRRVRFPAARRTQGPGLSAAEVEARSTLAKWLVPGHFPAMREQLIAAAIDAGVPDDVVDAARQLPSGREFGNVGDAWQALGGREETPPD